MTEAAQARLGHISAAREDIDAQAYRDMGAGPSPAAPADGEQGAVPALDAHPRLADDLDDVVARATDAFGHAPLMVDLTREELGVPVVKVVAPGSRVSAEVL